MFLPRSAFVVASCGALAGLVLIAAGEDKPAGRKAPAGEKKPAAKSDAARGQPAGDDVVAAIRESASRFVEAYAKHDAKALAAGFTNDAQFVDENGMVLRGRDAIEKHFVGLFKVAPQARLTMRVDAVQLIAANVALEEGTASSTPVPEEVPESSRYVALHVKQDGQWLVARARDFPASEPRPASEHLRQLEWLVGDWVDEGEDSLIATSCKWVDNRNFLLQEFQVRVAGRNAVSGTTRIGWDPLVKQFRSWIFDSEGGFAEGLWSRDGDTFTVRLTGVTRDGLPTSATNIIRRINESTMTWKSRDRVVGGQVEDDIGEFTVTRRAPPPAD
ncbi:MAG: YybH family protein [Planctomycetaceae bacterium]